MSNATTAAAPAFESALFIPPSARLSPLAQAALEAGVEPSAVRAYLSARYTARPLSVEQVSL